MRKVISILLIFVVVMMLFNTSGTATTTGSYYSKNVVVTFSGGTRTVKSVSVDMKDPTIRLEVVCANNQVGTTDSLKDIAALEQDSDTTVVAAINGSFFNAYDDLQPSGTLYSEGELLHIANSGSVFGVDGENNFNIFPLFVKIEGSINNSWEWPNNWYAWNINHLYYDNNSSSVFTSDYGKKTPIHTMTSIVVDKKVVTKITKGQVDIPSDGFVLVTGEQAQIDRFKVGYSADYRLKYYENSYVNGKDNGVEIPEWNQIRSGVGAGPTLLINSVIVAEPTAEGFSEGKITESRATRSFIGVTSSNQLVMGVVDNVTIKELAEIAKNMGLMDAMNLDGGGSSGLLYNNSYVVQPGRELSNAIVITKSTKAPIRLTINGLELFFDEDPFIDAGRTMVPMRKIFEALGATVVWNGADSSITAVRNDVTIKLKLNSKSATVNGENYLLECPVVLKNSTTFVPVRFITEQFGGEADWVDNTVKLTIKEIP